MSRSVGPNGRVDAFAAERSTYLQLYATFSLNSLWNAVPLHTVLGEHQGVTKPPELNNTSASGSSFGLYGKTVWDNREQAAPYMTGRVMHTPMYSMNTLLELPQPSFLKADVEGMEIAVLRGAEQTIRNLQPVLYLENNAPVRNQIMFSDDTEELKASSHREMAELIEYIWTPDYQQYWHIAREYNINGKIVAHNTNMLCVPGGRKRTVRKDWSIWRIESAYSTRCSHELQP